jgi:hypothetical protein
MYGRRMELPLTEELEISCMKDEWSYHAQTEGMELS